LTAAICGRKRTAPVTIATETRALLR